MTRKWTHVSVARCVNGMFSEEKNITLEEFASLFTWEEVWIQDPATGEVSALKRVIRLKKEGER